MNLYVEVTHTERSDMNTGIPRVVRNILRNLLELGPMEGIAVLPIIFQKRSFVVVPPKNVLRNKALAQRGRASRKTRAGWTKFRRSFLGRYWRLLEITGVRS